jgi:hypothetical protein
MHHRVGGVPVAVAPVAARTSHGIVETPSRALEEYAVTGHHRENEHAICKDR